MMSEAKYDLIGAGHDGTRRPDPRIAARLKIFLQPNLATNARYLDVACGTGNYTTLLAASWRCRFQTGHSRALSA